MGQKKELYEHLVLRDFPAATRVFGVEKSGELVLDYADGMEDEESFYNFKDDTKTAAALSWKTGESRPASGDCGEARGGWEKYQDPDTWVHVIGS
ncbi:hypothetical protein MUG78_16950 [Gordonia alkaliphila]|uniref:hypothetical protein n=1 Tax=Gordonia alkaliphila TaxID=1053547 RepID=UPI001FF56847|nr:hypothetical protein [Gordonia alkaliphila]MCK0441090.1 hypothetical protein [Gordonia alkaliphila]